MMRHMFALASAALATPVLAALPVPAFGQASGDLGLVQQHLRGLQSMTADFAQTDRNGKTLTGTLSLKQPGKIRFQYQKDVPILLVSDGKALYFIDYSVKQVQRWPIGNTPLGILLNPSKDIRRIAKLVPSTDSRVISVEAADPRHPEYGKINLIFARDQAGPAGLQLQGWVSLDAQNNRTTVRLSNQHFNVPVSDGTFQWNDPRKNSRRN